jgi:hypothetical protein
MALEDAIAEALKVKIFFERQIFIIYLAESIAIDSFFCKVREILKLTPNQVVTVKWIDSEGLLQFK